MSDLGGVRASARKVERARRQVVYAEGELYDHIRGALAEGHAATAVAAAAGISRARVYQIRDGRR